MNTNDVFRIIEKYLFAFSSNDKVIPEVFPEGIEKALTTSLSGKEKISNEEIEKAIKRHVEIYLAEQIENGKLPILLKRYITRNAIKELTKQDLSLFDKLILINNYELTFEDLEKISSMEEIKEYLQKPNKEKGFILEQVKEYNELLDMNELDNSQESNGKDESYIGDNYSLYVKDSSPYELLTPEEEKDLLRKYRIEHDLEAREKLILCNQRLVMKVAIRYKDRGLDKLDLIQEGNIGLMKAIDKFQIDRDTKLSTYAMWWIKQAIKRAIANHCTTIRIPINIRNAQDRLSRIEGKYIAEYGKEPTIEKLIELTGLTEEKIIDLKKYKVNLSSLNKQVQGSEDESSELGDFIKSDIEDTDSLTITRDDHEYAESLLQRLKNDTRYASGSRMEQIMRMRTGPELYNEETYELIRKQNLEIKDKYTLDEIRKIYGITRERVRQLEKQAIIALQKYEKVYRGKPPRKNILLDEEEVKVKTKSKKRKDK